MIQETKTIIVAYQTQKAELKQNSEITPGMFQLRFMQSAEEKSYEGLCLFFTTQV